MLIIFLLGFFLRFAFMFLSLHGDLISIWEIPAFSIWNLKPVEFYYPPLSFIIYGFLSPIYFISQFVGFWILKIPNLISDVLITLILFKLIPQNRRSVVFKLWWLNPIIIYSVYAIGQNEIIMALILMLSVLVVKRSVAKAIFLVSSSIAFKTTPLFFSPALILFFAKNWKSLVLYSIGILGIPIMLGIAFKNIYRISLINIYFPFTAQGGLEKDLAIRPVLDFALRPDSIFSILSVVSGISGYLLLCLFLLNKKLKKLYSYEEVLLLSGLFVFIAYPSNLFHRYVIIIPLLILVLVKRNFSTKIIWILSISLIFGYLYTWPLEWGLLDHIFPQVAKFKDLREFVSPIINYEHIALAFRILTNIIFFVLALEIFNKNKKLSEF